MVNGELAATTHPYPKIVLDAAWWLKFTLISGWIVVIAIFSVVVGALAAGWYAGRHYMTNPNY